MNCCPWAASTQHPSLLSALLLLGLAVGVAQALARCSTVRPGTAVPEGTWGGSANRPAGRCILCAAPKDGNTLCSSLFSPWHLCWRHFIFLLSFPVLFENHSGLQNNCKKKYSKKTPANLAPRLSHAVCLPALSFALPSMPVFCRQKTHLSEDIESELHMSWPLTPVTIHWGDSDKKATDQGLMNNSDCVSHGSADWSPGSGCQQMWGSGEDLLPGSKAIFWLCPHRAEGLREPSGVSLIRAVIPSWGLCLSDIITCQGPTS